VSDEWAIWRCVTHEHMRASYAEITTMWTLDDLDGANVVLDSIDAAVSEQMRKARQPKGGSHGAP
jgi:hypothetical protein